MNTTKGNKIIAEFMGLWESEVGYLYNPQFEAGFKPEELKYHSSWDWLMPVVEKIESLGYCFRIESNDIFIMDNETSMELIVADDNNSKIDGVWWSCVEFIKWYNQNKPE